MLKLENISYRYANKNNNFLFENINYEFENNKFYAITGKSGCGKTTLLSLLGGLDIPSSGDVIYKGKNIKDIGYSNYREKNVSLVFQNYNLIEYMTPMENLWLVNKNASPDILIEMGLEQADINRNVLKLSGGQQQRVAIARAISQNTDIILLDEPTGNLDHDMEIEIIKLVKSLSSDKLVIVVTHSSYVASQADIIIDLSKLKKQTCKY